MTTIAVLHWRNDAGRARADRLVSFLRGDGLVRRAGGSNWMCLSVDEVQAVSGGFVLGTIIPRDRVPDETKGAVDDGTDVARQLVRTSWGRYVAIDDGSHAPRVMGDPSGAWPLWQLRTSDLTVVSDVITPEVARIAGLDVVIDRAALAATLLDPASIAYLGFVRGIQPLTPGCSYDLATGQAPSIWRMADHIASPCRQPDKILREAVDLAVSSMTADDMVMQLSGGLDSSIVLAAATQAGHRPHAVNFATHASAGDERAFSRFVASHLGISCTEVTATTLPDYRRIAEAAVGAAPVIFGLDDAFEDAVEAVASERSARGVITGQGGDAIFFQPATPLVTVDRRRAFGVRRCTWPAILDDARRTRRSIWHHLAPALRDLLRPASVPVSPVSPHLLTDEARMAAGAVDTLHPWLRGMDHVPPGKRMQAVMIANSQIFHHPRATGITPLCHPLLSQPVVEAALALPTYELACGDNDRGLARRAFSDRLPAKLLARKSKGEASDHYSRAARANLDFLRGFLLEGRLVELGIIDHAAMAALLTPEGLFHAHDYQGLAVQVSCEAWVRAWMG